MKTLTLIFALLLTAGTVSSQSNGATTGGYKAPTLNAKYVKDLGFGGQTFTKKTEGVWVLANGVTVYSSHPWGDNIKGFNGATPLFVAVDKGYKVAAVAPAVNTETPDFWTKVKKSKLFKAWNGLTLTKAAQKKVDAVSGATYSSRAVIQTVRATISNIKK